MPRKSFSITGRVQGVGFRPFVFRLAARYGLSGQVRNTPEGVLVETQGEKDAVESFARALRGETPPLARISACTERDLEPVTGEKGFYIRESQAGNAHDVLISPDAATCPDCLAEMRDPKNRRYLYPFINCTNCGPRYTITAHMPYDRPQTSMACFTLCPECAGEYHNPADRRFHAQPNTCPACGPKVWLVDNRAIAAQGRAVPGEDTLPRACLAGDAALRALARRIMSGQIAAVKGLGGFHLVCDATRDEAVACLRAAKARPHKPLAIMAGDAEAAGKFAYLGSEEIKLLESGERPIVLCPAGANSGLSRLVSPDTACIGLMLPYTPLHHILLEYCDETARERGAEAAALVMTSGNKGGDPIALGNREALVRLGGIADCFLLHDRDILIRADDSVLRPVPGASLKNGDASVLYLRRARGFVPAPLPLPSGAQGSVLGLGAELKNTICLSRGQEAFVSQHIGDLQNLETAFFQREASIHLQSVLQVRPRLAVGDAHPDFTGQGIAADAGLPLSLMPHHFAHASAVLAENGHEDPALALALDGTGHAPPDINPSGSIWGGELVFAMPTKKVMRRMGSLALMPMPGGEAAIRAPWRIAHALLSQEGLLEESPAWIPPWLPKEERAAALIPQMLAQGVNVPWTSSAGRLFDAVAALLGLCLEISYEGQAAIRLEEAQHTCLSTRRDPLSLYAAFDGDEAKVLTCPVTEDGETHFLTLDTLALFRGVYGLLREGLAPSEISRIFHWSLAEGLAELALCGSRAAQTPYVGLSGGVMQNLSLFLLLKNRLEKRGLIPLTHHALPANDACISYGQAAWYARR